MARHHSFKEEKRSHTRFEVVCSGTVIAAEKEKVIAGTVADLGFGGFTFESQAYFAGGEHVTLVDLESPDPDALYPAIARPSQPRPDHTFRTGFTFLAATSQDRVEIAKLANSYMLQEFKGKKRAA